MKPLALFLFWGIVGSLLLWHGTGLRGQQDRTQQKQKRTVYDTSVRALKQTGILIPREEFTWDRIRAIADDYLRARPSDNRFAELLIAYDEADLKKSHFGTYVNERSPSIADTLKDLRDGKTDTGMPYTGIARVFALGDSALLTFRAEGTPMLHSAGIRELVVSGTTDPTWIKRPDGAYRLLSIYVLELPRGGASIGLFFRSEKENATCNSCLDLARSFQRTLAVNSLSVTIRPDTWFASAYFPLAYRFESDTGSFAYSDGGSDRVVPPTVTEFYRRREVSCTLAMVEYECKSYGPLEEMRSPR